jgi:hypothetical protein
MNAIKNILTSLWPLLPKPYPELAKLVSNYDSRRKAAEVLYLGDSVLERISWNDGDNRTLDRMLAGRLAGRKRLLCISHSAYHLKVFYHLLHILKRTRQKPELVIVPINMRSFSPQWDLNPAWQFDEEIDVLKKYSKTPGMKIPVLGKPVDSVPLTGAEKLMEVKYPFTELNRLGEFYDLIKSNPSMEDEKRQRKKQIYIFHYLHPLSATHPKLQALPMIMELLRELHIGLLVYVTPINYQGGARFIGEGFIDVLRANIGVARDLIAQFTGRDAFRFLDLSEALSSEYFFHPDEATEHLNQDGRAQLAEKIANEIFLMDVQKNGVPSL